MEASQLTPYADAQRLLEELTVNAASVQHHLLSDILAHNSHCEYLLKLFGSDIPCSPSPSHLLHDAPAPPVIDPLTFKKLAPLSCYEDIEPFIDRIAAGETTPILTSHPVIALFKSSGTSSGQRKLLPGIERDVERTKLLMTRSSAILSLMTRSSAILSRYMQKPRDGRRMMFHFMMPDEWTAGGVLKLNATSFYFKTPYVRMQLEKTHASPTEVVFGCKDVAQSAYLHLLCGLIRRNEVVHVGAIFAATFIHVLRVLQQRWCDLVEDIRSGCLSRDVVSDECARKAVEVLMKGPNPTLAMQVEEECTREPLWKRIVPRLWPHAKYVSCATSGSMEQYISELEFFTGELPLVSMYYSGSEGTYVINMNPLCRPDQVSYTILPDMAYFEFLPLDAKEYDQSSLVSLVDVELGKEYEIVVTTYAGLYRFQVGDILRVTGFYNSTPQFRVVGRENVLLSVDSDKTDEATLEQAVRAARVHHLETAGGLLADYTSYTDPSTFPGHYVLFWEVIMTCNRDGSAGSGLRHSSRESQSPSRQMPISTHVLEECCMAMENCFDAVYKDLRKQGRVGPLEVRLVKEGTFRTFMDYSVARGASVSQFKTPRVIKLAPMIKFFNSKVCYCVKAPT